jgi:hypothetical protein
VGEKERNKCKGMRGGNGSYVRLSHWTDRALRLAMDYPNYVTLQLNIDSP